MHFYLLSAVVNLIQWLHLCQSCRINVTWILRSKGEWMMQTKVQNRDSYRSSVLFQLLLYTLQQIFSLHIKLHRQRFHLYQFSRCVLVIILLYVSFLWLIGPALYYLSLHENGPMGSWVVAPSSGLLSTTSSPVVSDQLAAGQWEDLGVKGLLALSQQAHLWRKHILTRIHFGLEKDHKKMDGLWIC